MPLGDCLGCYREVLKESDVTEHSTGTHADVKSLCLLGPVPALRTAELPSFAEIPRKESLETSPNSKRNLSTSSAPLALLSPASWK